MSAGTAVIAHRRPLTGRAGAGAGWRVAGVMIVSLTLSGIVLVAVPSEVVSLTAPLLANLNIALLYTTVLLFTDRQVPVFEIGSLWVAATLIYSSFPFLGFMAGGMNWTADMDSRLQQYPFVESEIVWFAWQYTMYLTAFVITYLLVRRRAAVHTTSFNPIQSHTAAALVIVFAGLLAVKWGLYLVYGITMDLKYDNAQILVMMARIRSLPLVVWQISNHLLDAMTLARIGLALLLLANWKKSAWARWSLIGWLVYEVVTISIRQTARTPVVLLALIVGLLYHRLVRQLRLKTVLIGGAALLAGFLLLGVVRLGGATRSLSPKGIVTTANEFQALFATAFDLYQRKQLGMLGQVPWQVYAVDLYLEIPRQLLPFEKIDPSLWYLEVIGAKGQGVGFMFGVMSQAVVGLGAVELVLRGMLLGLVFGLLHRWYVRRAQRLWPTIFYLFISIWSFFTFRATSFWFVHFIIYQFVPFFVATKLIEAGLRSAGRRRMP